MEGRGLRLAGRAERCGRPGFDRASRWIRGCILMVPLLASACMSPGGDLPALPDRSDGSYRLASGDRLSLVVFGEEDFNRDYLVGDNGQVTVPLIGAVAAEGLTASELESMVCQKLSEGILVQPSCSVQVAEYRPFFILGETRAPGQYAFVPGMTVMTAVSIAGGFTFRAEQDRVSITRMVEGARREYRAEPLSTVVPGDVIYVFERYF